jgi:hypothetical protein
MILFVGVASLGCKEEMVGAPCVPETDKGDFNKSASGVTYSIETRSVQCETRICLTKTDAENPVADSQPCEDDPSMENCWDGEGGRVQFKFSFCSCRCKDVEGHTYNQNPDKYDDLCECPPNTQCEDVLGAVEGAPEKIMGSYCVPNCIASPCGAAEICSPSKDSEKPWEWTCKEIENNEDDE